MTSRPEPRLHEWGSGQPVLVLPGLTFPAVTWEPICALLSDRFHCLVVDLPGHGASASWDVVSVPELADSLARPVAARSLPPPVLVGHSYGALVALAYAARHPVAAVVTVDQRLDPAGIPSPDTGLPPGGADVVAPRLVAAIGSSLHIEALPSSTGDALRALHQPTPDMVVPYLRALEGVQPDALLGPLTEAARRLAVPWFDVHRGEPGQQHRRAARGAEVQVWDGVSHCLHLEQPQRLADMIRMVRLPPFLNEPVGVPVRGAGPCRH